MSTLEPIMEAVAVPTSIGGDRIIDDLCNRIAEKLSRSCNLRIIDRYGSYSAQVEITLQLHDVYLAEESAAIAVGSIDPHQPSERVTLAVQHGTMASADSKTLERPIDPAGVQSAEAQEKRYYTPRNRQPKF